MLACRIHAKEDLRIEPVAVPEAGPGEVLLRLGAAGICGSDLHYYFEGRNGNFVVREPLIPGHEASAVVDAVGAGVTRSRSATRWRCRRRMRAGAAATAAKAASTCEPHALSRQREPLPARAGHVPGIHRDGRAGSAIR